MSYYYTIRRLMMQLLFSSGTTVRYCPLRMKLCTVRGIFCRYLLYDQRKRENRISFLVRLCTVIKPIFFQFVLADSVLCSLILERNIYCHSEGLKHHTITLLRWPIGTKQNHKTQNRITKPKNRIAKPKAKSQQSKQNHKTQNTITKP